MTDQPKRPWRGKQVIRFDGFTMADPESEELGEAMHTARYNLKGLTQAEAFLILGATECYLHLTTHPAGTEAMVRKLRLIRRTLREWQ